MKKPFLALSLFLTTNAFALVDIGFAGGFPVVGSATLGIWGASAVPLFTRVSFGMGAGLDLGVQLTPEAPANLYLAASAGLLGFTGIYTGTYASLGPTIGVKFYGFWIQAGPDLYSVSGSNSFSILTGTGFMVHGQAGFAVTL